MAVARKPKMEMKDRVYVLISESTPITYQLRSRHTKYNPLLHFDGKTNRALRYCSNQKSCFMDMQDDNALLEAIVFEDGKLVVKAHETVLQDFLTNLHPDKDKRYKEFDPETDALEDVENIAIGITAQAVALDMDIADIEAIARVLWRSNVDKMTSSVMKRDVLLYAKQSPERFMELANDTDIKLRNLAIKSVDLGILILKDDNTTIAWADGKKVLIKIKYGDNPYSSLAAYFKTDEGIDAMKAIQNKLK
jgi:hypothetical protein